MGKQQLIDITGQTFGFLEVLGFSHMGGRRRSYWKCRCTRCGKIIVRRKDDIIYSYSHSKSCCCWHPEESRQRAPRCKDKKTGKFTKVEEGDNE